MVRVFFAKTGRPAEVLQVTPTAPIPSPAKGQVRLRVLARPINPSDLLYIEGLYAIKPELPAWPGFEGVGVIEALGEGVDDLVVGTRVAFAALGTWQEYVCVPAHSVVLVPEVLSDAAASQLYVNPFTAWALLHKAQVVPGDWILVSPGASAVSQILVQLARERGILTLCTVRRDDHRSRLKKLGATVVVNVSNEPLEEAIREFTAGRGVAHAFEAVGGSMTERLLPYIVKGGTLHLFGLLSLDTSNLNLAPLIFRQLQIQGFWLTDWLKGLTPEVRETMVLELVTALADGSLKLPVEAEYPLEEVINAVLHAELPGRFGKIILVS